MKMNNENQRVEINFDITGIGTIIAVILSWLKWHSIGWAIIHGLLSWLYVIYYVIKY